jgi:PmbA protein
MADLMALAIQACQEAVRRGAQFADAEVTRGRSLAVNVESNGIHDASERRSAGISVRSIIRGATGFAQASSLDEAGALETARRSAEAAKLAQPDPDFVSLPGPSAYEEVPGLYDQAVAGMSADELIRTIGEEIDGAREVAPDVKVQGGAGLGVSERALANSLGVRYSTRKTELGLHVFCIVKKGDDVGSYYDFDFGRTKADFAPRGLGAATCREAVGFLGSRSMRSATLPVVFGPLVSGFLFPAICASASAEEIQRRRSYLVDRRGRRIGSELLTLRDDGYVPRGMASGPCDGEGAPRRKVTVVERGVLVSHLHGSYTANKAGEANTGHGSRSGGVRPTNVVPELGGAPAAEILADTKEGIYVNMGSVFPHPVTGDISATVDFGHKIENGRLAGPLKNTMLGLSIFDLLGNLEAVSSDCRREPGMIMPTIRVRGVKVAGAS